MAKSICGMCIVLFACASLFADESRSSNKRAQSSAALTKIIDARIDTGLKSAAIVASELASDAEFIRRIHLDLHGVVPTANRVRQFLNDSAADKRAQLIDQLLADRRFAAHLADLWDDYLIPSPDDPRTTRDRLNVWLEEAFETKSWDCIAYDLLTASGQRDNDAVVTYLLKGRETLTPAELTDMVSQYFLGMRLNCAQCHDHPFTSWKQADYWGLASFFTQIQYTDRRMQKSGVIRDNPAVDVAKLENAEKLRAPRFLRGDALTTDPKTPHRVALAEWITAPNNPYFARAMANRMWWQLFGRGLVEPVDDMHLDKPITHPELLAELTEHLVASGFDLRYLCRAICSSSAYQRTSMPSSGNENDATLYSHMAVKVLTPEQLYDSLQIVAPPSSDRKGGQRSDDPRGEFVQFFRAEGEPRPTIYDRGIPQTLRMMNSLQVWSPRNETFAVKRIIESETSHPKALDALYLHVLARVPTDDERKILDDFLERHPGPREQAYAEIMWGLLNSSEFSLNH